MHFGLMFLLHKPSYHLTKYTMLPPSCQIPSLTGGDEGTRTPDLLRAREALSHLSYIPKYQGMLRSKWAFLDLNQRPFPYQRNALAD